MRQRIRLRAGVAVAAYEAAIALVGWAALAWWVAAHGPVAVRPALLFLLLAVALKGEGFRIAQPVTHSLAGAAALAALIALGPASGVCVAGLSGALHLASRPPDTGRGFGLRRWRLALFGGGLNALMALAGAALYQRLGGVWAPAALRWADLVPLAALSLAWFFGDHLGWSARIALGGGRADLARFLRTIRVYSLAVELLPLPLAAVVAVVYSAIGTLAYLLLALFLVAVGEVLRLLVITLARARARVADLTTLDAFSRAVLASKLDVMQFCRLLCEHTRALVGACDLWLGLARDGQERIEVVLAEGSPGRARGQPWEPPAALWHWMHKHRAPLRVGDAARDALPFDMAPEKTNFASALFVPLQASGSLLGLLAVRGGRPQAFSGDDQRTIVTFANQTAMAIQNALSLEAEQRRARQVHTVGEVSRRVAAILGMERLFPGVVNLIRDAFGYYHVQLFTAEPASGALTFQASTCPIIQQRGFPVAPGQGLIGWVAETGEHVVVDDVTSDPRYRLVEGLEGTRSEAVVPLKIGERLVGILDVESDRAAAFGEDDLYVLQTLAGQIAIAIEDNRLYRAEKARRQLADTLRETATALNSTLEPRAVLDLVLTQLERVIRYDAAAILEWRGDRCCFVAVRGRYAAPDRCLTAGEEVHLRRLAQAPVSFVFGGAAGEAGEGAPASLAVPLLIKGSLIGALVLERQGQGAGYTGEEIQVVSTFASQAATAIENARLYEGEQRRARQLAAISEVGRRVASILDLDELFVQVVQLVREQFGYYHVSIATIEPEAGLVAFRASAGAGGRMLAPTQKLGEGIVGWVADHGQALLANEVAQESRYLADEALPATESELAVPLQVEGRTVGVLDIQGDRPGAFGAEDLFIMQTLADQVAVAIENGRLYAAQQEEAWVSTALLQVAETLANLTGIEDVLDAVIRLVPLLVGVDRCSIFLRDGAMGPCQAVRAHGLAGAEREAFLTRTLEALAPNLWQAVQQSPAPVGLDAAGSPLAGEARLAVGLAGGLALPLRAGGETIGAMVAGQVEAGGSPNRNRRTILMGIANQAAMAIRNAHLYRESLQRERIAQELRVARQIQATFLPEAYPSLPGVSIAAMSQPAREVGGDFYDFIPLGAERLGLVIADVSDKGVPAALFMALSRTVMRAVAAEGHSPAATLRRANEILVADARSGMFVTLFYGVLDSRSGELAFASAGHNPPYWYRRREGRLVRLECSGAALGVMENPGFDEGRVVLAPGDALILYTDGVSESLDPDQHEFGEAGLRAAVERAAAGPAEELVAAVNEAVQTFVRGAPQFDDYTLMAIKRLV